MAKKKVEASSVETPVEVILKAPSTENVKLAVGPKVYPFPETKEDYSVLHKLLKDIGVNSIGDLEVKASRL